MNVSDLIIREGVIGMNDDRYCVPRKMMIVVMMNGYLA